MITSIYNWFYQKQGIKTILDEALTNVLSSYYCDKIASSLARLKQSSIEKILKCSLALIHLFLNNETRSLNLLI